MAATAAQIATVRRMVVEPTTTSYSDAQITAAIERYPVLDANGEEPLAWDMTADPPTTSANARWVANYNLNAAAADIWEEKAAAVAGQFDFSADGGSYKTSQISTQYLNMAQVYRSRKQNVSRPLP